MNRRENCINQHFVEQHEAKVSARSIWHKSDSKTKMSARRLMSEMLLRPEVELWLQQHLAEHIFQLMRERRCDVSALQLLITSLCAVRLIRRRDRSRGL